MSDEKQESVADIVADIRERAENAMRNGERLVHNEAVANMLTFVADRLDAARKRDEERVVEHATRHAEAVARDNCRDCVHNPIGRNYEGGSAEAMREALEFIKLASDDYEQYGTTKAGALDVIYEKACAALSAPARNCDMPYNDRVEMYGAFKDWCRAKGHTMEPMLAYDAFDWLLAPAKRKGATA